MLEGTLPVQESSTVESHTIVEVKQKVHLVKHSAGENQTTIEVKC